MTCARQRLTHEQVDVEDRGTRKKRERNDKKEKRKKERLGLIYESLQSRDGRLRVLFLAHTTTRLVLLFLRFHGFILFSLPRLLRLLRLQRASYLTLASFILPRLPRRRHRLAYRRLKRGGAVCEDESMHPSSADGCL